MGICSHVVAYSYAKALDWYGSQYRHPVNFKKGAEPSRVHSKQN